MQISSCENEKVKRYRKLSNSRKWRERLGLFCLEGARLVGDAMASNICLETVFVTQEAAAKYCRFLAPLEELDLVYKVTSSVAAALSDVHTSQGVFAIAKIPKTLLLPEKMATGNCFLALCGIQDPGNLGTMLRTADGLGVDGALLYQCCDPYNPKTVRSAMGSLFHLPFAGCDDILTMTQHLNVLGIQTVAAALKEDCISLENYVCKRPIMLYIGNEGNGLAPEILQACQTCVKIPMKGKAESLNAAAAAAICLWEFSKIAWDK